MRTTFFLACAIASGVAGCKWTDFDDLENETWVRSTQDPELGANDYAAAIAGVDTGAAGGTLAVVSDDSPNYSTLEYAIDGSAVVGTNPEPIKLNTQNIGAIGDVPMFVTDDSGMKIALVERSLSGSSFSVLFGAPNAPGGLELVSADMPTPQPDAVTFAGGTVVFAAGNTIYSIPPSGSSTTCKLTDSMGMAVQVAGMGVHLTSLVVWTKAGKVLTYSLPFLANCVGMTLSPQAGEIAMATFMPAAGARVYGIGTHVVLAGKSATSRVGEVYVIDMSSFSVVGTALAIDGMRSSAVAELGGATYFVAGVPDRSVERVAAGAVELYELDETTGILGEAPVLTLHDAKPESGAQYGRTVTTMSFRGESVLVVGAAAEIFAYFRVDPLYDHLP